MEPLLHYYHHKNAINNRDFLTYIFAYACYSFVLLLPTWLQEIIFLFSSKECKTRPLSHLKEV